MTLVSLVKLTTSFNLVLRGSERIGDFDRQAANEFSQCLFDTDMEGMVTRGFGLPGPIVEVVRVLI